MPRTTDNHRLPAPTGPVDSAIGTARCWLTHPMNRTPLRMRDQAPHERPRERLEDVGAVALSDAELVAIHLGSGSHGQSASVLASQLLRDFGGVAGLARAEVDELCRHPGVGPAKACRLVAAFALADRASGTGGRPLVRTTADIANVAIPRIGRARTEHVLLLLLDGSHRVCRVLDVAKGGATSSVVPVREVLSLALRYDAVAIALAHNHPSGSLAASPEDVAVTARLRKGADQVGVRFLDHVIVAGDRWSSVSAAS